MTWRNISWLHWMSVRLSDDDRRSFGHTRRRRDGCWPATRSAPASTLCCPNASTTKAPNHYISGPLGFPTSSSSWGGFPSVFRSRLLRQLPLSALRPDLRLMCCFLVFLVHDLTVIRVNYCNLTLILLMSSDPLKCSLHCVNTVYNCFVLSGLLGPWSVVSWSSWFRPQLFTDHSFLLSSESKMVSL